MEAEAATATFTGILRKKRDRSGLVNAYTGVVTAAGVAIAVISLTRLPADWIGLTLFACTTAIAELLSVELFASSRARVSVSSILAVASILVFGPWAGALTQLTAGIMTAITTSFLQKHRPEDGRASLLQRSAFNTAMWVLAAALAGWTYVGVGGAREKVALLSNIGPLTAAVIVDVLANITLLIGVITLQTGRQPLQVWRQDFLWGVPIAIIGGLVGGGVIALSYETLGVFGLLIFLLPVLSTSYSFRVYAKNTRRYVNELEGANQELEEANSGLLETLGSVIDADDAYTYGHSTQVAVYGEAIAKGMGLSVEEQNRVVRAALVHDIGKVGILDTIIGKQGPLTDEEYNMVKRHPLIGSEIVGRMKGLRHLVPLVKHHHERWDGRGYPDGLEGEEIPSGARILALADSLEAMCSDRPYRPTPSVKEAIEEIKRCSGTQFDPVVVRGFLRVIEKEGRGFVKNSAVVVDNALLLGQVSDGGVSSRYLKKSMAMGVPESSQ